MKNHFMGCYSPRPSVWIFPRGFLRDLTEGRTEKMNKRPPFCPRSQCHAPQPQGQQCPHCHKHRPLEDRAIKPATRDGRPASCFLSRCHKAPGLPPPRPPHDHPRDRNKKAAVSLPRPAVINETVGPREGREAPLLHEAHASLRPQTQAHQRCAAF